MTDLMHDRMKLHPPQPTRMISLAEKIVSSKAVWGYFQDASWVPGRFQDILNYCADVIVLPPDLSHSKRDLQKKIHACDILMLAPSNPDEPVTPEDMTLMYERFKQVGMYLREGQCLLYTGNVFPGTGRLVFYPGLKGYGYQIGQDYAFGYIAPEHSYNTKTCGGLTPICMWLTDLLVHKGTSASRAVTLEEGESYTFIKTLRKYLHWVIDFHELRYYESIAVRYEDASRAVKAVRAIMNRPLPSYLSTYRWLRMHGYHRPAPEELFEFLLRGWNRILAYVFERTVRTLNEYSLSLKGARILMAMGNDGDNEITLPEGESLTGTPMERFISLLVESGATVDVWYLDRDVTRESGDDVQWFSGTQWLDVVDTRWHLLMGFTTLPDSLMDRLKDRVTGVLDFTGSIRPEKWLPVPVVMPGDAPGTGWKGVV